MSKKLTMDQFKEKINSVNLGNYDLGLNEMKLLKELCNNDMINLMFDSYRWGFVKGSRSAKAEQKKTLTQELIKTAKEA